MFSAFKRSIPQISIFHNAKSPPSVTALNLLQSSLSNPYPPGSKQPLKFNLEVVESPPTTDQLRTILSYLPSSKSNNVSSTFLSAHPSSSSSQSESLATVSETAKTNPKSVKWPIVVDWDGGSAAVGNVDDVKTILEELRKVRDGETESRDKVDESKGWFS
ncbi:thioredoxin-like protein [Flagelloscypha sp. PMI_526]|nr:thioredoxin-like protein [Flagelloscypha sp. PMI_526]